MVLHEVKLIKEENLTVLLCVSDDLSSFHLLTGSNIDITDVPVDSACLPLMNIDGGDVLRFYWFDAFEDHLKQPGTVYLFGKVWVESAHAYVSCCLTIKNIERRVYLLPRKYFCDLKTKTEDISRPVVMTDVYQV